MALKKDTYDLYCRIIDRWFVNGQNQRAAVLYVFPKKTGIAADKYWERMSKNVEVLDYKESKQKELAKHLDIDAKNEARVIYEKIQELEKRIESGRTYDSFVKNGKPVEYTRFMTELEISRTHDTILKYRNELNKMIGGHSPVKVESKEVLTVLGLSDKEKEDWQKLSSKLLSDGSK